MLDNNSLIEETTPLQFRLSQNYPNPFTEKTIIKYCIAFRTQVKLTVYNSEGVEIKILVNEEQQPGAYEVEFYASTCHSHVSGYLPDLPTGQTGGKAGMNLLSGLYFYRLEAGNYKSEKEMELQN